VRDFAIPLRVLMPEFVPSLLAADLIAQEPGDNAIAWTEERVRADLNSWDTNVTFSFTFDSIRGRLWTSPTGQSPRSPGFDADIEWAIFPEGAWLYCDSGQLDLGLVRDSTLNAINRFQTLFEGFECVARLVPLSWWITSSLRSDGASQAARTIASCSPQGS
jgi:hypothetical protein